MKTIVILTLILATPCVAKDLNKNKKIAPVEFINAAYELLTFTPPQPKVTIVEKVIVNGRSTIRVIQPVEK